VLAGFFVNVIDAVVTVVIFAGKLPRTIGPEGLGAGIGVGVGDGGGNGVGAGAGPGAGGVM